jgi:hypothetical protein
MGLSIHNRISSQGASVNLFFFVVSFRLKKNQIHVLSRALTQVVEFLPSIWKALGSIPRTEKKKKFRHNLYTVKFIFSVSPEKHTELCIHTMAKTEWLWTSHKALYPYCQPSSPQPRDLLSLLKVTVPLPPENYRHGVLQH